MYRVYKAYRRGDAVPVPHRLKIRTVAEYARRFGLEVLIETGAYKGDTVAATLAYFREIYTIELSHELAEKAKARFCDAPKVHIHEGDSGAELRAVLEKVTSPCLFWLDAHYSAGITARGVLDSPIVKELDTIFELVSQRTVILIDDAREFTGHGGYPTIEALQEHVLSRKPEWRVLAYNDIIRIWDPRMTATE